MSMFKGMLIRSAEKKGPDINSSNSKENISNTSKIKRKESYTDKNLTNLEKKNTNNYKKEIYGDLNDLSLNYSTDTKNENNNVINLINRSNNNDNNQKQIINDNPYTYDKSLITLNEDIYDELNKIDGFITTCNLKNDDAGNLYEGITDLHKIKHNGKVSNKIENIENELYSAYYSPNGNNVEKEKKREFSENINNEIYLHELNNSYPSDYTINIENKKKNISLILDCVQNIFKSTNHWDANNLKRLLDFLGMFNNKNENMLIVAYYFTYHSYINRKFLDFKRVYNYDLLIYKLLLNINKIKKKRKKCKEKERILIINEKLDTAHVMQKKITNYNLIIAKIENKIIELFEIKKNIYNNSYLLKYYVHNLFKIIVRNIYINKKEEKKKRKKILQEKKSEIQNQESKLIEKENEIKKEEQNIHEHNEQIEKDQIAINEDAKQISEKYDKQLNTIDDQINDINIDIKELEKQIELKKKEKEKVMQIKAQIEKEKDEELKNISKKQSEINTSINFIKNTQDLLNEKKSNIINEKNQIQINSQNLLAQYQSCYQKGHSTNSLISSINKIIQILDEDKIDLFFTQSNCEQEEKEFSSNMSESDDQKISCDNTVLENNDNTNTNKNEICRDSHTNDEVKTNEKDGELKKENVKSNLLYILKNIYVLKKNIFELEKNSKNINEQKKKLMIDISQYKCDIENINIKKENFKNKKKILLKNKMLNEIKNIIKDYDELLQTEEIILKQVENSKNELAVLKKDHLLSNEEKEKLKKKLFMLEKKLIKLETLYFKHILSNKVFQKTNPEIVSNEGVVDETEKTSQSEIHQTVEETKIKTDDVAFIFSDDSETEEEDFEAKNALMQIVRQMEEAYMGTTVNELNNISLANDDLENDDLENEDLTNDDLTSDGLENNEEVSNGKDDELKDHELIDETTDVLLKEMDINLLEKNYDNIPKDNNPHINRDDSKMTNVIKNVNTEEKTSFQEIFKKYTNIYCVNENIDYSLLENEIDNFENSIIKEENNLKRKKLVILSKKKNVLKKYYEYNSDNSEDEINI
ncbi:conserved Plasmodium protein, unknown function [Plasmodium vinckei vinckei]|uniref:Uncharacterized protein n=1 Tax=Plasmodium vinckei vinckei TaxID=54757 RepID=A0A449BR25_PLAVN|nr:conserved Plasmodium protein, unknown function [Plasmodium vinckei vinckei]KEG01700.1 hypothetical protein YYE_03217 [Plasmodium vinckei vinckei]VEV55901.1 conserved Plasmodium protein, unknown function [Plasmodium vinckei vinckei]